MKTLTQNPAQWRLTTLLSLQTDQVHELARWALGTVTAYRLVVGRCLLAMHQSRGYKAYGCSTAVHYGASVLGMSPRVARECKRVAEKLQDLPGLTLASERGEISWSKLREIVRVATSETEDYWLELAVEYDSEHLQRLVSVTPLGQIPGDVDEDKSCITEFRIAASPELIAMFRRARRMFGKERDENVSGAETLEYLLASFFSSQSLDCEALEEARLEADKDLQAEQARRLPEVIEAREKAEAMGLFSETEVGEPEETITMQDLMAEATGAPCYKTSLPCEDKRKPQPERPSGVPRGNACACAWQNTKLRFNPTSRHTTKAQKRELLRRDGWCCSTPGCPNRSWIHIHHVKPYSEGGSTTQDNLICLCSGCHRNVHTGSLKITLNNSGRPLFTDAEGRKLHQQANLEIAAWIDFRMGWPGSESNSHQRRVLSDDWAVFGVA